MSECCVVFFGTAVDAPCLVAKDLEAFGIYAGSPLKRIKAWNQGLLELEKRYLTAADHRANPSIIIEQKTKSIFFRRKWDGFYRTFD